MIGLGGGRAHGPAAARRRDDHLHRRLGPGGGVPVDVHDGPRARRPAGSTSAGAAPASSRCPCWPPTRPAGSARRTSPAGPSGTTTRRRHRPVPAPRRRVARCMRPARPTARSTRASAPAGSRASRAPGAQIRIKAMARDYPQGGSCSSAPAPRRSRWCCACAPAAARDSTFGNGGLTFPLLGRPPGGDPIYTTFDAIDNMGSRAIIAGSAAGPGRVPASGQRHGLHRPLRAHGLETAVARCCSASVISARVAGERRALRRWMNAKVSCSGGSSARRTAARGSRGRRAARR